jgi:LysR family carnitine catabolism transcriptional activator
MNVTSRQLKGFLLVARHRSFSRAAEQMFMTQSGLSVLMREIENQLGFRLFDRTTRHVELTEHGTQFLAVAQDHVRNFEAVVSRIRQSAAAASQWLSVGAPPMTAAHILPEVIAHFSPERRNFRVRLHDTDLPRIAGMVKSGELDLGLGMFVKPTAGLARVPLFRFSLVLVRSADAKLPGGRVRRWSDLSGQTFIGLPPDNPIQQLVAKHLSRVGHRQPPDLVVNYHETLIGLVEARAGVAIMPSSVLPACRNRRVVIEPLVDPVVHLDLYQIRHRGRVLPPEAQAFTDFLKTHIASWAGRDGAL